MEKSTEFPTRKNKYKLIDLCFREMNVNVSMKLITPCNRYILNILVLSTCGKRINSSLIQEQFLMVVYAIFVKVQSEFSVHNATKYFLIDNHCKTIFGPVRSECSSCRMVCRRKNSTKENMNIKWIENWCQSCMF